MWPAVLVEEDEEDEDHRNCVSTLAGGTTVNERAGAIINDCAPAAYELNFLDFNKDLIMLIVNSYSENEILPDLLTTTEEYN